MEAAYGFCTRLNGGLMRTYLDPTAPIAPDALLADDPKVAMDLAVAICESPRMSNLAHGLWGYHGTTRDGTELTIQSLGIGGPSAAAVMADLARLGVSRAIRIGSCIALDARPGARIEPRRHEFRAGRRRRRRRSRTGSPSSLMPALTEALARAAGDAGERNRSVGRRPR